MSVTEPPQQLPTRDVADAAMLTRLFLAGRGRTDMTLEERQVVETSVSEIKTLPGRQLMVRAGDKVDHSTLLLDGFICRYMDDREGHRQLVAVHVPGDFVDLHGFPMQRLDHDVASLGPVTVALVRHDTLTAITEQHPRLTRFLWFSTLLDAAMHREWIFRIGRLSAEGRLAHFFLEIGTRLALAGVAPADQYALPITQSDLGEACGLTGVHVNRTLRMLRELGLLTFRNGEVVVHDWRRLAVLGDFDPFYLYGEQPR